MAKDRGLRSEVLQIEKSSSKNLVLRNLMNTLSSGFSPRSL
jgi:hypothetical protein